jgi:cellobiose-specific phosphotransferase system component IIA
MGLIINSGQARSLAYAALKQAKQGISPRRKR